MIRAQKPSIYLQMDSCGESQATNLFEDELSAEGSQSAAECVQTGVSGDNFKPHAGEPSCINMGVPRPVNHHTLQRSVHAGQQ